VTVPATRHWTTQVNHLDERQQVNEAHSPRAKSDKGKRRFVMSRTPNNKSALAAKLLDRWKAKNQSLGMMLVKARPPANQRLKTAF
jgi:hypothetical protein